MIVEENKSTIVDKKTEYSKDIDDLLYLLTCAINLKSPELTRINEMNLDCIFEMASFHSVVALVAYALESVIELPYMFDQAKKKAIRKQALFDIERNKILSLFKKEGIWFMPLKGVVIKDYYPKYGMREMSDNDILCNPDRMHDVKSIMENLGYLCEEYEKENHDVYSKHIIFFEFHRALFHENKYSVLNEYYKGIQTKLICNKNDPYVYSFSLEDLYIYLVAHTYKHYSTGGIGIRSLLDTNLFLKQHSNQMNWNYNKKELKKLSLTRFEEMNRELSNKVFSCVILDNDEKEHLMYYFSSGAHGTDEHLWNNRISNSLSGDDRKNAKQRYIFNRLFINGEELKTHYPFFYRFKFFLPLLYIFRLIKAVLIKPKMVLTEYKHLKQFKYTK